MIAKRTQHAGDTPSKALLVLGMHRSGTSAITRVLNLLGTELPGNLLPPTPGNNETGFWEPAEVVSIHDELLSTFDSSWHDIGPLELPVHEPRYRVFAERLSAVLRRDLRANTTFIIKDPRLCRLVPLWLDVLERLGVQPHFIIWLRNPLEVVASLRRRNDFPVFKSLLLWLRHVLEAEKASQSHLRSFASYDELLEDWRGTVTRIGRDLDIEWPRDLVDAEKNIHEFLSPALRRNRIRTETLEAYGKVSAWVKDTYRAALHLTNQESAAASEVFSRVRAELEAADAAFGPILKDLGEDLDRTESDLSASLREAETLISQNAQLETDLAETQRRQEETSRLSADTRRQLSEILASRSWRWTAPLRRLRARVSLF